MHRNANYQFISMLLRAERMQLAEKPIFLYNIFKASKQTSLKL